jgi:hypothetical protein
MNCRAARQHVQRELDGELSIAECEALHKHLDTCEECRTVHRQFVTIQTAMRQLANGSQRGSEDLPPPDFPHPRAIARGVPWRASLAAAAVIALCVGAWLAVGHLRTKSPVVVANKPDKIGAPRPEARNPVPGTRNPEPDLPSPVRVRFAPPSDVIAVPIKSRNPNVTIIWLYPTAKTAQKSERDVSEQTPTTPRRQS